MAKRSIVVRRPPMRWVANPAPTPELDARGDRVVREQNQPGWERFIELLKAAVNDRRVVAHPLVLDFAEFIFDLTVDASSSESPFDVLKGISAADLAAWKSNKAKAAADAKHGKPGGAREKAAAIVLIWRSGKYSSRDICAEQECAQLGMSFSTARKALRNK